jgi:PAS domain S-box-containing protein
VTVLHPLLQRHLKRAKLDEGAPPADLAAWQAFLSRVGQTYTESDQDRYLLERSMALSSTEMRELQGQLASERDMLKTVIRSLVEGVCVLSAQGHVLFITPEALRLLGLSEAECLGRPLAEVTDLRDAEGRSLAELMRAEHGAGGEDSRIFVRGDEGAFLVFALRPVPGLGGGAVLTLRDISERKRSDVERAELNARLVTASRQAGMAEVAIGVLHNVGNVLNSMNVSASLIEAKVRDSRAKNLAKVTALFDEHAADLGAYLTRDEKGRQLPGYLSKLASHLAVEQREVGAELELLRKNVDHIKQIVATQQAHARTSNVEEVASAAQLMDDALRINAAALERQQIAVERRYGEVPPIYVDKHKVLQILVNLVSNAGNALDGGPPGGKHLVLSVDRHPEDAARMVLAVTDDGAGIAPENMPRLFEHGFTTRADGHGFGLHSAANAAKTMKGSLRAHSAGRGSGATFTLELPIHRTTQAP